MMGPILDRARRILRQARAFLIILGAVFLLALHFLPGLYGAILALAASDPYAFAGAAGILVVLWAAAALSSLRESVARRW